MTIPKFDKKELEVVSVRPAVMRMGEVKIYSYPVSAREAYRSALRGKPYWQIAGVESRIFTPKLLPDNVSRALVFEAQPFDNLTQGGGPDMFGIEWEYIPVAGGSMVRPGKPFAEDANDILGKLVWPDIDKWDWEGSAAANNGTYLTEENFNVCWLQTGYYERLISLMDFENAIMALFDEDQKDAVHAFFDKLTDLYIRIFGKFIQHFPLIDSFYVHDDWGSQKETFFSPEVVREMIVPHMKRLTEFIHSKGLQCELHSCGQLMKQVPNMIAAGWDTWSGQRMNDTQKIYELYGDKIIIGVTPDLFDPETASEEDQRRMAREYAEKFCNPDKPSVFNVYGAQNLTPAYREELYIRSRECYSR